MKRLTQIPLILLFASLFVFSCTKVKETETPNVPKSEVTPEEMTTNWYKNYLDQIWNKGDFTHADTYFSTDFQNYSNPQTERGPLGMQHQIETFRKGFTDLKVELKEIIFQGNKIVAWSEITGTHSGDIFGIPATNKTVTFRECDWYTYQDNKFTDMYSFVDWNAFFEMIGQYPGVRATN